MGRDTDKQKNKPKKTTTTDKRKKNEKRHKIRWMKRLSRTVKSVTARIANVKSP